MPDVDPPCAMMPTEQTQCDENNAWIVSRLTTLENTMKDVRVSIFGNNSSYYFALGEEIKQLQGAVTHLKNAVTGLVYDYAVIDTKMNWIKEELLSLGLERIAVERNDNAEIKSI